MKWRPNPNILQIQGPVIEIVISTTRTELQEGRALGLEYPALPIRALIDTGAALTIINPQVAATCQLLHTDWNRITAVGGAEGKYPAYAASISFPRTDLPTFEAIRVVACPIIKQPYFSCLIGRDMLRKWKLLYDGPNGDLEITA